MVQLNKFPPAEPPQTKGPARQKDILNENDTLDMDVASAPIASEDLFNVSAALSTRSGRTRRTWDFAMLSDCTCGVRVSNDEAEAKVGMINCKKTGCETRWVSTMLKHPQRD